MILDPWNGSGTTTQVAEEMGIHAIGLDINPAMVVIAKARCLQPSVSESLPSLCHDILVKSLSLSHDSASPDEPLEAWFATTSASCIRSIERAIQMTLVDYRQYRPLGFEDSLANLSTLAAFFYTAMFRTLRILLTPFRASNPTWVKIPKQAEDRLTTKVDVIREIFADQATAMCTVLRKPQLTQAGTAPEPLLDIASSEAIPLPDHSIHAMVGSPPYCTRIDYAISTRPELALLGFTPGNGLRELRGRMIGTPTISAQTPEPQPDWGGICLTFLDAVENHASKASRSYYRKSYLQYFHSIYRSLKEIDRVLIAGGYCILVVQDSYYKDLHNDLPAIFGEMGMTVGWEPDKRSDFAIARTMAGVNHHVAKYRSRATAVESVLTFRKK